jgi:hypothetical protein
VREQVTALSNANLDKLATAHGIDPAAPEYSRAKEMRDEGRHQTGRDKLAEDITQQMGEDEKINIGRKAEQLEHKAEMANKTKAQRAESLFPRLRGKVDEFGNAAVSGGAPDEEEGVKGALKEIEGKFPVNPDKPGAGTVPKEHVIMKGDKPESSFTVSE